MRNDRPPVHVTAGPARQPVLSLSGTSEPDGVPHGLLDGLPPLLGRLAPLAADVVAGLADSRWPQRELAELLGYLRTEMRQRVVEEERRLFPGPGHAPEFDRLRRDHVRLSHLAEALAEADGADGASGWGPLRLATAVRDLVALLERHLVAEEALLAATRGPRPRYRVGGAVRRAGVGGPPVGRPRPARRASEDPCRRAEHPVDCGDEGVGPAGVDTDSVAL